MLGSYHQRDAVWAPRPMQEHLPTAKELNINVPLMKKSLEPANVHGALGPGQQMSPRLALAILQQAGANSKLKIIFATASSGYHCGAAHALAGGLILASQGW